MSKEEKYSGDMKIEKPQKVTADMSTVSVTFLENRKYDLHIGNDIITFLGHETKSIPSAWLKHVDWQNVSAFFSVKGV
jgi:hypothetical protein